jgi:hypothetical protein
MKFACGVLIADVIGSTGHSRLREALGKRLRAATKMHLREKWIRVPYAVTAGDEFQTVTFGIECIPELILDLRRKMRPFDLRIGVGIGTIRGPVRKPVNRLGGQAFVLARHAIEDVKSGALHKYPTLTAFRSARKSFDEIINLVYGLHDTLVLGITDVQWQAIDAYLAKKRVDRTARALGVDRSTASRNLKRAHYWQLAEVAESLRMLLSEGWLRSARNRAIV